MFVAALSWFESGEFSLFGHEWLDLVFAGALPSADGGFAVLSADVDGHGGEAVFWVECVFSDVAVGDDVERDACVVAFGFEGFEVLVDGLGFPSGVGEDGVIDGWEFSVDDHSEEGGGLDACSEGKDAERVGGGFGGHNFFLSANRSGLIYLRPVSVRAMKMAVSAPNTTSSFMRAVSL